MAYNTDDTIVALSTPPGVGALGVIRLSGEKAIDICDDVFKGKKLKDESSHTLHYGTIVSEEKVLDEVVVGLFKAPNSYTKEDVVEISCHGSPFIQEQIIELLIEKGARLAKPGEFTLRAFLNGRMDLSQAEAVADLIAANTEASHKSALQQIRGGFSNKIKALRDKLVDFASLVELELDFSEEDVEFADKKALSKLVKEIQGLITNLIESFKLGNVVKNGVNVVIAGRPNAGKSTLLNRLLNEERAIVSEIPGTTRDTIEEVLNIDGVLFRMVDTAGIREAQDTIEKIGVEKTMEKIRQSSLLVYVFDAKELGKTTLLEDIAKLRTENIPLILVGNKIDLFEQNGFAQKFDINEDIVFISSKEDQNIDTLKQVLIRQVLEEEVRIDDTVVTNSRHYEALLRANEALEDVLQGIGDQISGELLALDIRRALESLGEITGEVTNEDVLGNIFSSFCIGK